MALNNFWFLNYNTNDDNKNNNNNNNNNNNDDNNDNNTNNTNTNNDNNNKNNKTNGLTLRSNSTSVDITNESNNGIKYLQHQAGADTHYEQWKPH